MKHSSLRHTRKRVCQLLLILFALAIGLVMIIPFLWMVATAFRDIGDAYKLPPSLLPETFRLDNFKYVLNSSVPFLSFFKNSILITALVLIFQLLACTMAGYGFARLRFPGKNILFFLILGSMMIPVQVTTIPAYVIMNRLGLVDTHAAVILMSVTSAFGVFLLRQFFTTVPKELEEAAKIDGAGHVRTFTHVMMPQAGASIATLAILSFNTVWNDYFRPLMFLNTWEKMTLALGIGALKKQMGQGNPVIIMAAVTMSILPLFLFFLFAQRYFVEGMTLGAVKG